MTAVPSPDARPGAASTGPPPALLTVTEACAVLRISRWSFYRLLRERRVRTVKIGSRRLVPAEALDELVTDLSAAQEDAP